MTGGVAAAAQVDCFGTEAELWAFLTGEPVPAGGVTATAVAQFNAEAGAEAVISDAADEPGLVADATVTVAAASVLLGYEYDGSSYSGTRTTFYGASGSCSSGDTFGFANLGSYGWNDRTSSATTYAGCRGQHYRDASYAGGSITCSPNCSTMGTLNNATSSIVYRP